MTFDRIIETEENARIAATFTQVHAPTEKFFVSLDNGDGNAVSFEMVRDHTSRWRILLPAPDWVFSLESRLSGEINGRTAL